VAKAGKSQEPIKILIEHEKKWPNQKANGQSKPKVHFSLCLEEERKGKGKEKKLNKIYSNIFELQNFLMKKSSVNKE